MPKYYIIYKPYGVLSQFTREAEHHQTLADLFPFPKDVYPVGRLDKDSEGLLILTDDTKLNARLLHPLQGHSRSYIVQVEGYPELNDLAELNTGLEIRVNKKTYKTLPAKIRQLDHYPELPERLPPVRYRKNVPTRFLEITLTEGKNRQVRRMFAKLGFPVLRLVRHKIAELELAGMQPGEVRAIDGKILYQKLFGKSKN